MIRSQGSHSLEQKMEGGSLKNKTEGAEDAQLFHSILLCCG